MEPMTDCMVDLETTGTSSPDRNGILQLAAIKFNFDTGEIGSHFDRCPMLLRTRHWDEDTRDFWQRQHRPHYMEMIARQEPAITVYGDFIRWVGADGESLRFWAKPTHFDWPLLSSHLHQMGSEMPFHYRHARDLNSVIAGMRGRMEHTDMTKVVPFDGLPHNALHDCGNQIDILFAAKAGNFTEVL